MFNRKLKKELEELREVVRQQGYSINNLKEQQLLRIGKLYIQDVFMPGYKDPRPSVYFSAITLKILEHLGLEIKHQEKSESVSLSEVGKIKKEGQL